MRAQFELVAGDDRGVTNLVEARTAVGGHGLAVDDEVGDLHLGVPFLVGYLAGVKPGDAAHTAE